VGEASGEQKSADADSDRILMVSEILWNQLITLNPAHVLNSTAIRVTWQVHALLDESQLLPTNCGLEMSYFTAVMHEIRSFTEAVPRITQGS